jgi:hypothetical protein
MREVSKPLLRTRSESQLSQSVEPVDRQREVRADAFSGPVVGLVKNRLYAGLLQCDRGHRARDAATGYQCPSHDFLPNKVS